MSVSMEKGKLLYEGKGKKVYEVKGRPDRIILVFKDSLTAWQGEKKGEFSGKGICCQKVFSLVFRYLRREGILNHWVKDLSSGESLCVKTRILPLEVVVRNRLAGSTAKRLGFSEGESIPSPLLEYYYKRDDLQDPFVSEEQLIQLPLIQKEDRELLPEIKRQALLINGKLQLFFSSAGIELIDFKMEFGADSDNCLMLSDDITPDSCRLWDMETGFRMDKDRFRHGWGRVEEGSKMIERRIFKRWGEELKDIT